MATYDWLHSLAAETERFDDVAVVMDVDGEPHSLATNGHVLIAVRGAVEGSIPASESRRAQFGKIVARRPASAPKSFEMADLRAFLGVATDDAPCAKCANARAVECTRCRGTGEDECLCPRCEDTHTATCEDCDGAGRVACPACRGERDRIEAVVIAGEPVNRWLLAKWLCRFPDGPATWSTDSSGHPALVRGEGWIAWVMPLRVSGLGAPRFKFATEVAA